MSASDLPLTKPCQMIVEGRSDCEFFRRLCAARGLETKVGVRFTAKTLADNAPGTGNSGFYDSLDGLRGAMKLSPNVVKGVIVVADNDSDPNEKYEFIREQVARAGFPAGAAGATVTGNVNGKNLSVSILMVPSSGTQGNLESVLLSALPIGAYRNCVDGLITCAGLGAPNWRPHKIEEARLGAYLSCSYHHDPGKSLANILADVPRSPFDMSHTAFDGFNLFLRRFLVAIGELTGV